jgi:methylated-DNA-[protein]-cysteine S-methyltransferase
MIACSFSEESQRKAEAAITNSLSPREDYVHEDPSEMSSRFRELHELYNGRGRVKQNSLDLSNVSPFRERVYSLLCRIPRGRVTTYGTIAKELGSLRYARAVGTANGSNPMPLAIPCHRVVLSTLRVGCYGMPGHQPWEGSQVKTQLLEREGVKFRVGKVLKECLWYPK